MCRGVPAQNEFGLMVKSLDAARASILKAGRGNPIVLAVVNPLFSWLA